MRIKAIFQNVIYIARGPHDREQRYCTNRTNSYIHHQKNSHNYNYCEIIAVSRIRFKHIQQIPIIYFLQSRKKNNMETFFFVRLLFKSHLQNIYARIIIIIIIDLIYISQKITCIN